MFSLILPVFNLFLRLKTHSYTLIQYLPALCMSQKFHLGGIQLLPYHKATQILDLLLPLFALAWVWYQI